MGPFDVARSERDKGILRKPCLQLYCWSTGYKDSWIPLIRTGGVSLARTAGLLVIKADEQSQDGNGK